MFKLALVITLHLSVAFAENQLEGKWHDFVRFDNDFNEPLREEIPKHDFEKVDLHYFDLPADQVKFTVSRFIDAEAEGFIVKKDNKWYVRFPIAFHNRISSSNIKKYLDDNAISFESLNGKAQLLLSHATFMEWTASGEPQGFVKFFSEFKPRNPRRPLRQFNTSNQAHASVIISDAVSQIVKENRLVDFLPEPFSASFKSGTTEYSFTRRSLETVHGPPNEQSILLPLHGVVGSDIISELARAKKMSVPNWILTEYLPKFANFLATCHFELGVYPEAHNQNLLMWADRSRGEVERFVFRDANDVMFDFLVRTRAGKPTYAEGLRGMNISQVNSFFVDGQSMERSLVGNHFITYDQMPIDALLWPRFGLSNLRGRVYRMFIDLYLKKVSDITGVDFHLDRAFSKIYSDLYQKIDGWDFQSTPESNKSISILLNEIHSLTIRKALPTETVSQSRYDQSLLRKYFVNAFHDYQVAYPLPDAKDLISKHIQTGDLENLLFGFDGRGVYAISKANGAIIGYAYNLNSYECNDIAKTGVPTVVEDSQNSKKDLPIKDKFSKPEVNQRVSKLKRWRQRLRLK